MGLTKRVDCPSFQLTAEERIFRRRVETPPPMAAAAAAGTAATSSAGERFVII